MADATRCEVCSAPALPRVLRDGTHLSACSVCRHVTRDLESCPAHHRSAAYGGDPGLDRVRLGLTMRALDRRTDPSPERVFEIGFGAGQILRRYLDRGTAVGGCDPDQLGSAVDPVVRARGDLHHGSIEDVMASASADLVVGVHVIEHVVDVRKSLAAANDVLTPGGRLALFTPVADSWSLRVFSQSWWLLEDPTHVRFFTRRSMILALQDAGFADIRTRRLFADNLTMEGASLVRVLRPADRPAGVLAAAGTRWFSLVVIPFAALIRAVVPRWRPTLLVTARRR